MTSLPQWVDFESSERTAAVMARDLSGPSEAWGTLLAQAQAVLSARTDTPVSELPNSYEFSEWRDLVAAARILDLAATTHGLSDVQNRRDVATLAACAFGMSGAAVSATAVIDGHRLLNTELSEGELVALSLSSPAIAREAVRRLPIRSRHRDCIEHVLAFLALGDERQLHMASEALQSATFEEPNAWEGYLLRLSGLSLAHMSRLSTAKVLRPYEGLFPQGYLKRLVDDSPLLLPSQYEAITMKGVATSDRNLLIALPTATGKTLLGELALMSSLGREPGLVCYIAPYVALGRQVADKINRHTPTEVRVHRLVGNYQEPDPLDPENRQEVLVATPERFDALLRLRPEVLPSIGCVVFDEAHMIGNGQRGVRLEGIITRLRLKSIRGGQVPRFVLLSAVLSNSEALAKWVDIEPANVVRGTWRPSAKRLLRWTEDGMLKLHAGDDPMRHRPTDDPLRHNPIEVIGETLLPWPKKGFYQASFYQSRKQLPQAMENVAYLAEFKLNLYKQPVLCVCSTRSNTRILADQLARRFSPIEPLPQSIRAIIDLINHQYPYLRPLREALGRGVAYHNSSLPHEVREGIERAIEGRHLRVIAATTTLAEGVDLPFRTTILADWTMYDGETTRPMSSLLFKNIAGRCGRAGQFTEGDTIIFDNPVGDAQLTYPSRRTQFQDRVFFSDDQPALISAIGGLGRESAVSNVGSQLLAAIAENPAMDNLAHSFHTLSFAYQTSDRAVAAERISIAHSQILDESDGQPLAVAASPIQLTAFGEAANSGGLSPTTAKRLRAALRELVHLGSSREDFIEVSVGLLKSLGDVPEQSNPDLRRGVTKPNSRPVVRMDELAVALRLWASGKSFEEIFAELPSKRRSRRSIELDMWLRGTPEESTWIEDFTKFHDFMTNCVVEYFLPWVLRAARPLAEIDDYPERPWREWARFVELGIDSPWGVRLLDGGIVSERTTARQIGQRLDELHAVASPSVDQVHQVLIENLEQDERQIAQVMAWYINLKS